MSEQEKRLHRCSFTGHRPEKLRITEQEAVVLLKQEIEAAIQAGFQTFITGMARGIDIWAAEIVLQLRDAGQPIRLICASPYNGFERRWPVTWQERYADVIRRSDLVRYICRGYSPECFQIRNEWMVNHSARVIAVFNGERSGTKNTIDYANRVGVPVVVIRC